MSSVEMLVAMVVLLLLMMLTIGVISSINQRVESVNCMENLRQIGFALLNYKQEHQLQFPKHYDASSSSTWFGPGAIGAYLPAEVNGAYVCPATKVTNYSLGKNNYVYNYYLGEYGGGPVTFMQLASPYRTLIVADGTGPNYAVSTIGTEKNFSWSHTEYGNWLFADGHVEAIKQQEYLRDWIRFPIQ